MSLEVEESTGPVRLKLPFRYFGRVGNCFCALIDSSGEPWVCIGPDWPFCLILLVMMCAVAAVFVALMAPMVPAEVQVFGALAITAVITFFLTTAMKNPGIELSPYYSPADELPGACTKCRAVLREGTVHCDDCNLCIRRYDHHCPLTGKCIGAGNLLCFYALVVSVMVFFGYGVVWTFFATAERDSSSHRL